MATIKTKRAADRPLLEGLLGADAVAVRTIYDTVLPGVLLDIRQMGGTESTGRDVFQEGLMALYKRLQAGDFMLTCTLKSYLRVVCRKLYLRHRRDRQREVDAPPGLPERVDLDPLAQTQLEHAERERVFWYHFDRLETGCRDILRAAFAGHTLREIAAERGTTENYIKKRKSVCKKHLLDAIRQDARYDELTE